MGDPTKTETKSGPAAEGNAGPAPAAPAAEQPDAAQGETVSPASERPDPYRPIEPPHPVTTALDRELAAFGTRLECLKLAHQVSAAMGGGNKLALAEDYYLWVIGQRDPNERLSIDKPVKTYADLEKEDRTAR